MTDPDAYREIMGRLASGLAVVATRDTAGQPVGLLLQAIFSLAVDPPRLLISVGTASRTLPSLLARQMFSVNVLGGPQADLLSARFASTADDKFAGLSWRSVRLGVNRPAGPDGDADRSGAARSGADQVPDVPVLTAGVTATLVCRLEEHLTRHRHVLLIAEPLLAEAHAVGGADSEPLIYYRHGFHPLRPAPIPAHPATVVSPFAARAQGHARS